MEPDQEVWLEGWTECDSWQERLSEWYASDEFKSQAALANPFYESISDILGNRPKTLENAWNLFDFLNVEFIHDQTLSDQIGEQNREIARYWANYHEAGSFSDEDISNVGNVAGQAVLPPLLDGIFTISNTSQPLKITYLAASYKPVSMLQTMSLLASPADFFPCLFPVPFSLRHDETRRTGQQCCRLCISSHL